LQLSPFCDGLYNYFICVEIDLQYDAVLQSQRHNCISWDSIIACWYDLSVSIVLMYKHLEMMKLIKKKVKIILSYPMIHHPIAFELLFDFWSRHLRLEQLVKLMH